MLWGIVQRQDPGFGAGYGGSNPSAPAMRYVQFKVSNML